MGSLNYAQVRNLLAKGVVRQVGTDSPIALRLRYVGKGTVTSVTVTTATNLVVVTSAGTSTYAFATHTTVGALADAINADGEFEAVVIDALRSDPSASAFVNGAITAGTDRNGVVVWDVNTDTSATSDFTVALSPLSPEFDLPSGHRVHLQEVAYNINLTTAGANGVQIISRRGANETVIYSAASVDDTLTVINFADGAGKITGVNDEELIVRVEDGGSLSDAAGNFLRVSGIVE